MTILSLNSDSINVSCMHFFFPSIDLTISSKEPQHNWIYQHNHIDFSKVADDYYINVKAFWEKFKLREHHTLNLLQADQLLDITTGQLLCIICKQEVQEDMSGMPRHDTRLLLTKFNEQMEPLFNLLREVRDLSDWVWVDLITFQHIRVMEEWWPFVFSIK